MPFIEITNQLSGQLPIQRNFYSPKTCFWSIHRHPDWPDNARLVLPFDYYTYGCVASLTGV